MKPSIVFKGIVKGAYSLYQSEGLEENPVMTFKGSTLKSCLKDLIIPEWTGILKVNGIRVPNIMDYIEQQGLDIKVYKRTELAS